MVKNSSNLSTSDKRNKQSAFFYGYIITICSFLILLVAFGTNYSFGIFFNQLREDLEWSRTVTSTGYSIAVLVSGIIGIVLGKFTDRFGPRVAIIIAGISLSSGCILMSIVNHPWQIYLVYGLLVGVGFGGAIIPLTSTISRWFVRHRGLMTGIVVSGIGTGTIVMPFLANSLLEAFSWRISFIIMGLLALVVMIPASLFLKRDPSSIGQLPYGINEVSGTSAGSQEIGMSFGEVVHTGRFWMVCLINLFVGFYIQGMIVHIVPYAKSLNIESTSATAILSFIGFGSIFGRIVLGSASDRIGVKYAIVIALGLNLVGLTWLLFARSVWMFCALAIIYGAGYGALIALQSLAPAKMFGVASLGVMAGVITFIYTGSGAIGPIVTGYICDVTGSYHPAFLAFALLSAAGLVLALTIPKPRSK